MAVTGHLCACEDHIRHILCIYVELYLYLHKFHMYLCAYQDEEEDATEEFLRKVATVLLMSGNKRFFAALSKSIANGIPCLARACLVTVAWMSSSLILMENADLQSLASSTLVPRLLESLNYDRALEERVLATLSLLNFVRNSGIGEYPITIVFQ